MPLQQWSRRFDRASNLTDDDEDLSAAIPTSTGFTLRLHTSARDAAIYAAFRQPEAISPLSADNADSTPPEVIRLSTGEIREVSRGVIPIVFRYIAPTSTGTHGARPTRIPLFPFRLGSGATYTSPRADCGTLLLSRRLTPAWRRNFRNFILYY